MQIEQTDSISYIAAYYNHLEIWKFLMPLVKDPFIPNSRGWKWNALDIAGQKGHSEIVKYLTSLLMKDLNQICT